VDDLIIVIASLMAPNFSLT